MVLSLCTFLQAASADGTIHKELLTSAGHEFNFN